VSSVDAEVLRLAEPKPFPQTADLAEVLDVGLDVALLQLDVEVLLPVRQAQQQPDDGLDLAIDHQAGARCPPPLELQPARQLDGLATLTVGFSPGMRQSEALLTEVLVRLSPNSEVLLEAGDRVALLQQEALDDGILLLVRPGVVLRILCSLRHRLSRDRLPSGQFPTSQSVGSNRNSSDIIQ
jgi:hypothetical protein